MNLPKIGSARLKPSPKPEHETPAVAPKSPWEGLQTASIEDLKVMQGEHSARLRDALDECDPKAIQSAIILREVLDLLILSRRAAKIRGVGEEMQERAQSLKAALDPLQQKMQQMRGKPLIHNDHEATHTMIRLQNFVTSHGQYLDQFSRSLRPRFLQAEAVANRALDAAAEGRLADADALLCQAESMAKQVSEWSAATADVIERVLAFE